MLYILWYSLIVITLSSVETSEDISKFTSDAVQLSQTEHTSSVESSQENETSDKIKDFAVNVEEYHGNALHEQAEVANDVFDVNQAPMTKSSSDTALPQQDEINPGLERESLSQNHESEFKESSETDLNHSSSTIEQKPTHKIDIGEKSEFRQSSVNGRASPTPKDAYQEKQIAEEDDFQPPDSEATQVSEGQFIDTNEKSEFYQSSGYEHASHTPEDAYQHKQRADEDDFQPSDSEAAQVRESQLIEPEDTLSYHDRTERSFTEINKETRLNPTDESLVLEADSTIESKSVGQVGTDGDINEITSLAETRENLTRELAVKTESKLKEYAEAEDDFSFNEDNHLNQIGESIIRESASSIESNPTQQTEVEDSLKPIFQNALNENSYIIEDEIKKSAPRDENENFHLFNSSVTKVNQDNIDDLENKLFDHVSDLNSDGESELASELLQRTNNKSKNNLSNDFELLNDEALPEEKAPVKENFIPSNNANADGSYEYPESLMVRKIDSEHTSRNSSFPSENDKPVKRYKHPYSTHNINYQSEPDTLIQNNIEQLTVENSHALIDSSEIKTNEKNQKEFVTCETAGCLETATFVDHESADISSKLSPNIQKEGRIRDVNDDLEITMDSKARQNDSAHEENQGTFEYLENIEFNLHEVLHVIKTNKSVRAFILNIIILYFPVFICDVLLWIVIVKLARHIRRQIISNQQSEATESLVVQQNESEDVDRPSIARITSHKKSKRSEKDDGSEKDGGGDDFQDSSSEFLYINSNRKDWYPPS